MGWDAVIGQKRVVNGLERALASGRVAHAYLFLGPDGVGKRAVALSFAQGLLCLEPAEQRPCGTCTACNRVRRLEHPDVQFLMPQPNDASIGDLRARLKGLAASPYATVDFARRPDLANRERSSNKVVQYGISDVNDGLRRSMSFRPVEGRYKIAILTDAERLPSRSANAFLKLLEEPLPQTVFILTASDVDRLLPTVVSRCQQVRFDRLSPESIASALEGQLGIESRRAGALARMSDGSFSRALELSESEELAQARSDVLDFMRMAFRVWKRADLAAEMIEQLSRTGREYQQYVLTLLLVWLRDVMIVGASGDRIVNLDQIEPLRRFCASFPKADVEAMVGLAEEAIRLLDRNVNSRLLLATLMQKLAAAMHGGDVGRLYEPLAGPVDNPA